MPGSTTRLLALTATTLSLLACPLAAQVVTVPSGSEPTLDGTMGKDEWRDAVVLGTSGEASWLAMRAGDTLFVGLRGVGSGITTLGLLPDGETRLRVLHASGSLGTAEYERDGQGWKRTRAFAWGAKSAPGSPEGDAARAAFRKQEGWLGTLGSMGTGDSEMAIDLRAAGWIAATASPHLRCAIGHIGGAAVRLPAGSNDELFGLSLQMGTAPATLGAQPEHWLELQWADAPEAPLLEGFQSVSAGTTWVYAPQREEAQALIADVEAAARDFERCFGRAPEPGAVVAMPGSSLPPDGDATLRAAGARWVLPWISVSSPPVKDEALSAQIESQLREQLGPLGLSDAQIATQVDAVLAQLSGTPAGGLGLLRHELGHVWFISTFWGPDAARSPVAGERHYAGPAADWLDETAAILLESEAATASRRSAFAAWRAANPGRMRPLDELFTMVHPAESGAPGSPPADAAAGGSVAVRVQVAPGPEAGDGGVADDDCPFYEQCRSLADFLLERAGERVFLSLATGAAHGVDMQHWLAGDGAKLGLPASTLELQQAWLAWLDASSEPAAERSPAAPGR